MHCIELVDKIFKTCCVLHKFLLEADGMEIPWEGSFKYDYEKNEFEYHNSADVPMHVHEICRDYGELSNKDFSTVGVINTRMHGNTDNEELESE